MMTTTVRVISRCVSTICPILQVTVAQLDVCQQDAQYCRFQLQFGWLFRVILSIRIRLNSKQILYLRPYISPLVTVFKTENKQWFYSDPLCFLLYKNKASTFASSVIRVTKQNIIRFHLRSSYSFPAIPWRSTTLEPMCSLHRSRVLVVLRV
jgi:hypothetical protein